MGKLLRFLLLVIALPLVYALVVEAYLSLRAGIAPDSLRWFLYGLVPTFFIYLALTLSHNPSVVFVNTFRHELTHAFVSILFFQFPTLFKIDLREWMKGRQGSPRTAARSPGRRRQSSPRQPSSRQPSSRRPSSRRSSNPRQPASRRRSSSRQPASGPQPSGHRRSSGQRRQSTRRLELSQVKVGETGPARGGFFNALAPYFLPLFTLPLLLLRPFAPGAVVNLVDLLIGATYAFHLVTAITEFRLYQTDVTGTGVIFSFAFVLLMHILFLVLILLVVSGNYVGIPAYFRAAWARAQTAYGVTLAWIDTSLVPALRNLWEALRPAWAGGAAGG